MFLPPLLASCDIDISVRQLLPAPGETSPKRVIPSEHIPARFHARGLYEEDFVVAMRAGHPFADDPTLERYCEMQHLLVSLTGGEYLGR